MKKAFILVSFMLGIGLTQMNAQSFGIRADLNMSNFILSDMPANTESNIRAGATLGGFFLADITRNFAIQPELLFHFKSSESVAGNATHSFRYWGMEIPVYALGQWNVGNGNRFYAGLGPFLGIGFDARHKNGTEIDLYGTDRMQRWDFGAGVKVGFELHNGLQFNAGYKIGFINAIHSDVPGSGSMLNQTISLGLGFRFGR